MSGDLKLTKRVDKASPKLQEMADSGGEFEEITLEKDGVTYLLSDVKVTSVKRKGMQEVVNLRYASLKQVATTRAAGANHNTTRSNKTATTRADDHNSSRGNKTSASGADYNSSRSNNSN